MKVPFADLAAENAPLRAELDTAVARVLDSNRFILGPEVEAFEAELASAVGANHAVGVSSGTDALLVSLLALGVGEGDEVVTTPFSFFATAGAIARLGATPVFADIDPETLNLDPARAAAAVTDKTRALIPASLFGAPALLPEVDLPIIEDAAQSIGAGPPRSACATYSFFPAKNVGAFGDAGAVVTDDGALADRIRILRAHGAQPKYFHALVGGNFRLDAMQAALLRVKVATLDRVTGVRRAVAARYRALLTDPVRLPPEQANHVYNQFVIRAPRRDELRAALTEAGIGSAIYYPRPLHLQDCFSDLGYEVGAFPAAEAASAEVLALPCHPSLTAEQQACVADTIAAFYQ